MFDALIGPVVDLIINRISEANTSTQTIILGFITISVLAALNSLWNYLINNRQSIIYRLQGKHTIDDLEQEAQNIRKKIREAQEKLRKSGAAFESQVDIAENVVKGLPVIARKEARREKRNACNKVGSLKDISREHRIQIQDILAEMLANSSEAEKWFATRHEKVSSVVRKHSPLRKKNK